MTRNKLKRTCLLAKFEPRNVKNTLDNESWIEAMNEEIEQIERNKTQTLVPSPKDKNVIGMKWVFKNKLNEDRENGNIDKKIELLKKLNKDITKTNFMAVLEKGIVYNYQLRLKLKCFFS